MWIREKHAWNSWTEWNWEPELSEEYLRALRSVVKVAFQEFCRGKEQELYPTDKDIWTPIGFTPNDFILRIINQAAPEIKITFFNIRYFMHTIQIAPGTWESGPQKPYKRLENVFRRKNAEK